MLIEATLRRGSLGVVDAVQQARLAPYENVLIVVDQFEELFRFQRLQDPGSLETPEVTVRRDEILFVHAAGPRGEADSHAVTRPTPHRRLRASTLSRT